MDEIVTIVVAAGCLLAFAVVAGLFGIIGWVRAGRALAELGRLRALIAAGGVAGAKAGVEAAAVAGAPAGAPAGEPNLARVLREGLEARGEAVPGPEPEPKPGPAPALAPLLPELEARPRMDIELLLTQRWGVWVGAVALLLSAVFLVRYAVAAGLVGPGVRCGVAGLLGVGLIAGAEWLRRRPGPALAGFADIAPAALAAGGVGALFAAGYGAGPLYGLVSAVAGFVLLGAAGVAGLALSLVFGRLVGAVGLAAAFATPALVATQDPSLAGLFGYLLFVTAASWGVVRRTAWTWLGWAAAAGGAAWVLLVAAGGGGGAEAWAPGLFVPASAALGLVLLPGAALEHPVGRRFAWAPMVLLGLAGLALLSVVPDPSMQAWVRAGVLLLVPLAMAKGWVEPRLAWLPMVAAALAVGTLLVWDVPRFDPGGEAVRVEGVVQGVLPGRLLPAAMVPFLEVAALIGLLHAAAGLVGERRGARPLSWAALTAAVPVVALGVAYGRVGAVQPQAVWALLAGVLALGLVLAAEAARRAAVMPIQRAGVHAAGAVAALALGCAIVLDQAWLTVAIALMLPGLAWIEGAAGLPALRVVARVVAAAVLVRLLLNPAVALYAVGPTPVFNGLLVAYGLPALCFGVAARLFGRRGDDRLVAVLEAGACAFAVLLLVLEVHHAARGGAWTEAETDFGELAWQVSGLGAAAAVMQAVARGRRVLDWAWRLVGGAALLGGAVLLAWNPVLSGAPVGSGLLLNALLPGYLVPAVLAGLIVRRGGVPVRIVSAYALLAGFAWLTLEVRQAFHRDMLSGSDIVDAELWSYSGAWLAMAAGLMAAGAVLRQRALRLTGLGLTAVVVVKVFVVDMAGLDGLWRVLSFLGLGLGLIGLGALYRRFATAGR